MAIKVTSSANTRGPAKSQYPSMILIAIGFLVILNIVFFTKERSVVLNADRTVVARSAGSNNPFANLASLIRTLTTRDVCSSLRNPSLWSRDGESDDLPLLLQVFGDDSKKRSVKRR